jgi:hypothetical protein
VAAVADDGELDSCAVVRVKVAESALGVLDADQGAAGDQDVRRLGIQRPAGTAPGELTQAPPDVLDRDGTACFLGSGEGERIVEAPCRLCNDQRTAFRDEPVTAAAAIVKIDVEQARPERICGVHEDRVVSLRCDLGYGQRRGGSSRAGVGCKHSDRLPAALRLMCHVVAQIAWRRRRWLAHGCRPAGRAVAVDENQSVEVSDANARSPSSAGRVML